MPGTGSPFKYPADAPTEPRAEAILPPIKVLETSPPYTTSFAAERARPST